MLGEDLDIWRAGACNFLALIGQTFGLFVAEDKLASLGKSAFQTSSSSVRVWANHFYSKQGCDCYIQTVVITPGFDEACLLISSIRTSSMAEEST